MSAVSEFAKNYLSHSRFNISQLTGDAGTRQYFHITSEKNTFLICEYKDQDASFYNFIETQKLLSQKNILCPQVIKSEKPFMVLEDLGALCLEDQISAANYNQALDILLEIQDLPTDFSYKETERSFDIKKLVWEMNFAVDHLSKTYKISATEGIEKDFLYIATELCKQDQVFTHRDYHSRNLMLKENKLYVIDFQDARRGPYTYDLVSLIEDSYADLSPEMKEELKRSYLSRTKANTKNFEKDYDLQNLQRSFKACGSFASLKNLKNTDRYLKYLPIALKNLEPSINKFEIPNFQNFFSQLKAHI